MQDHGLVAKFDQGFRESKRLYTHQSRVPSYTNSRSAKGFSMGNRGSTYEWSQTGAEATNENEGYQFN
jgi:hypothetical protein